MTRHEPVHRRSPQPPPPSLVHRSAPRGAPRGARAALATFAAGALLALSGCADAKKETPPTETSCTPACGTRVCGPDGCGGTCGHCTAEQVCSIDGTCVDLGGPSTCDQSCEDLGYTCGDHCGRDCGACPGAQDACIDHQCVCQPKCSAATCEKDDGCGGTCPSCEVVSTCTDCPLGLEVVDAELTSGPRPLVKTVTVALDFRPPMGATLPAMADLRFRLDGPAELSEVAIGESLITAEKGFYNDPETGHAYRELPDGTIQLLVLSTTNTTPIPAGRWLFLKLAVAASADATSFMPLVLALVERDEVLAPASANAVLGGARYDAPIVVWPDAVEVSHAP